MNAQERAIVSNFSHHGVVQGSLIYLEATGDEGTELTKVGALVTIDQSSPLPFIRLGKGLIYDDIPLSHITLVLSINQSIAASFICAAMEDMLDSQTILGLLSICGVVYKKQT